MKYYLKSSLFAACLVALLPGFGQAVEMEWSTKTGEDTCNTSTYTISGSGNWGIWKNDRVGIQLTLPSISSNSQAVYGITKPGSAPWAPVSSTTGQRSICGVTNTKIVNLEIVSSSGITNPQLRINAEQPSTTVSYTAADTLELIGTFTSDASITIAAVEGTYRLTYNINVVGEEDVPLPIDPRDVKFQNWGTHYIKNGLMAEANSSVTLAYGSTLTSSEWYPSSIRVYSTNLPYTVNPVPIFARKKSGFGDSAGHTTATEIDTSNFPPSDAKLQVIAPPNGSSTDYWTVAVGTPTNYIDLNTNRMQVTYGSGYTGGLPPAPPPSSGGGSDPTDKWVDQIITTSERYAVSNELVVEKSMFPYSFQTCAAYSSMREYSSYGGYNWWIEKFFINGIQASSGAQICVGDRLRFEIDTRGVYGYSTYTIRVTYGDLKRDWRLEAK